jgi:hypothetical protein
MYLIWIDRLGEDIASIPIITFFSYQETIRLDGIFFINLKRLIGKYHQ